DWWQELQKLPEWNSVYHLIVVPTATESLAVLDSTFASLAKVNYQLDRMIVVLAIEQRFAATSRGYADSMAKKYGHLFRTFMITEHPGDIPGEVAGKGANSTWAGRQAQHYIDDQHIPYDDIIVSTFDADSIAHPQYFAYLTRAWLMHPDRHHTSY